MKKPRRRPREFRPGYYANRYGFIFVPAEGDDPLVRAFALDHLQRHGLGPGGPSQAERWVAVCKPPEVYAVFGWRLLNDAGGLRGDVTDFYRAPGRLGALAALAALERIRETSDSMGVPILTATPSWNQEMIVAMRNSFGVDEPSHVVHVYYPPKFLAEQAAKREEELCPPPPSPPALALSAT